MKLQMCKVGVELKRKTLKNFFRGKLGGGEHLTKAV